ncbi:MAG: hypothetical protein ACK5L3_07905 [Oscillospiraceae bacterium]
MSEEEKIEFAIQKYVSLWRVRQEEIAELFGSEVLEKVWQVVKFCDGIEPGWQTESYEYFLERAGLLLLQEYPFWGAKARQVLVNSLSYLYQLRRFNEI